MSILTGAVAAVVTPTKGHRVDFNTLETYINWLIDRNVDGIFALGTTGEGFLLTESDWTQAARTILKTVANRVPVAIQCGAISLARTLTNIDTASTYGAAAVAVTTPFYYHYSEADLLNYFSSVLSHTKAPMYLYNIPKYSGHAISPELLRNLAQQFPCLVGIKDSSGKMENLKAYREAAPNLAVLSGSDALFRETHDYGGVGVVSGVAAALPELASQAWKALKNGDTEYADKVRAVRDVMHHTFTIGALRCILGLRGMNVGDPVPPLPTLSESERQQIRKGLAALQIELNPSTQT